ncbi:MAG: pentapeptide repeat-containing protein [Vampirovibrionia bacterium]
MEKEKLQELLLDGKIKEFNKLVEDNNGDVDLSGLRLRSIDLKQICYKTINLEGTYLRASDLRGLDLSKANLKYASIKDAKIAGVLFPSNISAEEIMLSVTHGTRLRTKD